MSEFCLRHSVREAGETYLQSAVRQTTLESYASNFRLHVLPMIGNHRLDEITREKIKDFVAELAKKKFTRKLKVKTIEPDAKGSSEKRLPKEKIIEKNLSRPTIRIITVELSSVLNHALEDGLISSNPATRLGKHYKGSQIVHEEIEP